MNRIEALGIEHMCEQMFSDHFNGLKLSRNLMGRLRLHWDENCISFDINTGDADYIRFTGNMRDLLEACDFIKQTVMEPSNNIKLRALLWTYDNWNALRDFAFFSFADYKKG